MLTEIKTYYDDEETQLKRHYFVKDNFRHGECKCYSRSGKNYHKCNYINGSREEGSDIFYNLAGEPIEYDTENMRMEAYY